VFFENLIGNRSATDETGWARSCAAPSGPGGFLGVVPWVDTHGYSCFSHFVAGEGQWKVVSSDGMMEKQVVKTHWRHEIGSKCGIGVVLNYTHLHAFTRLYTKFLGGNVTGIWPRMKHGQNTDSEGTLNRGKPRKRRLAAKERRERKWGGKWGAGVME